MRDVCELSLHTSRHCALGEKEPKTQLQPEVLSRFLVRLSAPVLVSLEKNVFTKRLHRIKPDCSALLLLLVSVDVLSFKWFQNDGHSTLLN